MVHGSVNTRLMFFPHALGDLNVKSGFGHAQSLEIIGPLAARRQLQGGLDGSEIERYFLDAVLGKQQVRLAVDDVAFVGFPSARQGREDFGITEQWTATLQAVHRKWYVRQIRQLFLQGVEGVDGL